MNILTTEQAKKLLEQIPAAKSGKNKLSTSQLWRTVRPLIEAGLTRTEIADKLCQQGYLSTRGKAISQSMLSSIALRLGSAKHRARKPSTRNAASPKLAGKRLIKRVQQLSLPETSDESLLLLRTVAKISQSSELTMQSKQELICKLASLWK